MPFYHKSSPVPVLISQAKEMYSNENVCLLNLRGNFRIGLQSIIQTILNKMTQSQYEQCEAEFLDPVQGLTYSLYYAEVANQLAIDSRDTIKFDWCLKAALYYSTFLNNHVLKGTHYSEELKNHLLSIINPIINNNITGMLCIDQHKAESMLSAFSENDYFCHLLNSAILLKNKTTRSISHPPSSIFVAPYVPGDRLILSFFNKPAVPLPYERPAQTPPQKTFTHNPYQ